MSPASLVVLKASAFALLLGGLLLVLQQFDDHSDIEEVGYKTKELKELQAETIFVGSSRTYRHIDAARFDSLQGGGVSYNLGFRGGSALETHYQAERMLELPHVKRLVVELRMIPPLLQLENRDTRRTYYYHDLRHAGLAAKVALAFDMPLKERLAIVRGRYKVALDHYFLPGQGEALIRGKTAEPVSFSPLDRQGFLALDYADDVQQRNEAFLSPRGQQAFQRKLERIRNRDVAPAAADSVMAAIWFDLYQRAEAQGVEVYFAEQIGEAQLGGLARAISELVPPERLILINDLDRYPDLFDPDLWFDTGHLNERGARRITDIFAAQVP